MVRGSSKGFAQGEVIGIRFLGTGWQLVRCTVLVGRRDTSHWGLCNVKLRCAFYQYGVQSTWGIWYIKYIFRRATVT